MAAIKINNKTVQRIYKGADEVKAIYKGNVKIWERDFNSDKFHALCPAATATAVTFDYTSAHDLSALTFCGWVDLAETMGVYNSGTEYFVLSENEIRPRSCKGMFKNYSMLTTIIFNNFSLSQCIILSDMFYSCRSLTSLDLSGWDTSAVTIMTYMFGMCSLLTSIYMLTNPVIDNKASTGLMFEGCTSIRGGNGTPYNRSYRDKTYFRIDTPETPGYLTLKNT